MAILRVDPQFLMGRLLPGFVRASLIGARMDNQGQLYLTIEGPDVPDCEEVVAITTERQATVELQRLK